MFDLVPLISGALGAAIISPVLPVIQNAIYIGFGHKIELEKRLKEAQVDRAVKTINNEIEQELSYKDSVDDFIMLTSKEIEKNYSENPTDFIYPDAKNLSAIIDVATSYVTVEDMRRYLAKLLAATIDPIKADYVHPSFIETLKQLSPKDIQDLEAMYNNELFGTIKFSRAPINVILSDELISKAPHIQPFQRVPNATPLQLHISKLQRDKTGNSNFPESSLTFESCDKKLSINTPLLERLGLIEQYDYGNHRLNNSPQILHTECLRIIFSGAFSTPSVAKILDYIDFEHNIYKRLINKLHRQTDYQKDELLEAFSRLSIMTKIVDTIHISVENIIATNLSEYGTDLCHIIFGNNQQ